MEESTENQFTFEQFLGRIAQSEIGLLTTVRKLAIIVEEIVLFGAHEVFEISIRSGNFGFPVSAIKMGIIFSSIRKKL